MSGLTAIHEPTTAYSAHRAHSVDSVPLATSHRSTAPLSAPKYTACPSAATARPSTGPSAGTGTTRVCLCRTTSSQSAP